MLDVQDFCSKSAYISYFGEPRGGWISAPKGGLTITRKMSELREESGDKCSVRRYLISDGSFNLFRRKVVEFQTSCELIAILGRGACTLLYYLFTP